jgi:hypothetical protein
MVHNKSASLPLLTASSDGKVHYPVDIMKLASLYYSSNHQKTDMCNCSVLCGLSETDEEMMEICRHSPLSQ